MTDSLETPKIFAVRREKNNVVTWNVRLADETVSYLDVAAQVQKSYPSAIIISPKTPRSLTPKDTVSLISDTELIQFTGVSVFAMTQSMVRKISTFSLCKYCATMANLKNITEKNKNSHLPRKHKHYGNSLEKWHIAKTLLMVPL